jgi:hypothetical protein
MQGGGPAHTVDASRRNSLQVLLPAPGVWNFSVRVYDAMGQLSPPSPVVQVSVGGDPLWLYLPRLSR